MTKRHRVVNYDNKRFYNKGLKSVSSGLYYKTITIVIDAPSVVKSDAPNCNITFDDTRSVDYDRNSFIIQATGDNLLKPFFYYLRKYQPKGSMCEIENLSLAIPLTYRSVLV